jgi:hypothetical protein
MTVLSLLFSVNAAAAGALVEGYFWIIASEKARPAKTYSNSDFHIEVQAFKDRYRAKCGVDVQVWHSDLISKFRPGLWVIYTVFEEDRSTALSYVGADACSRKGYLKRGTLSYPRFLQACAANLEECKKDGVGPGGLTLGSGIAD